MWQFLYPPGYSTTCTAVVEYCATTTIFLIFEVISSSSSRGRDHHQSWCLECCSNTFSSNLSCDDIGALWEINNLLRRMDGDCRGKPPSGMRSAQHIIHTTPRKDRVRTVGERNAWIGHRVLEIMRSSHHSYCPYKRVRAVLYECTVWWFVWPISVRLLLAYHILL